jgi:DHA1 family arabinose polymer transporter-like MFS transporter
MNLRKSLLSLAIGGFGIGMTEFVIMGLLPDIATSFQVSIAEVGHVISAYAVGVVVGAPVLTILTSRYSPKKVLLALMALFTVGNAASSFASSYDLLFVSRLLAGLPHGAFFGVGAVVASRLAEKGKAAAAVAAMFSGLTIANVVGVPLGTYVGHNFGWRLAFVLVAIVGVLTILAISRWIPEMEGNAHGSLKNDFALLKKVDLWLGLIITAIGFGGFFAWFSYITPMLMNVTGFEARTIPWIMATAGLGMTVGNHFGGKLADRYKPIPTVAVLMLTMASILVLNALLSDSKIAMIILTFCTGANSLAMGAPIQVFLIGHSQESETFGASLGQAGFNVGNALGAFLAGIPLSLGYALYSAQLVGAAMALVGSFIAAYLCYRLRAVNLHKPIP